LTQNKDSEAEQSTVLTLSLAPEDHGRFVEVPFEVPAGTERVSVSCEVQGYQFAGQVVDLGLADPAGSRGWSGGARAEFRVEREKATPGYLPGEMRPGRWAVVVSSNRIPPGGCRVTLTVTCTMERYRWLRGDLHLHSVHSDGRYELAEVLRLSEAAGLDFIALTDHNTSSQNLAYPRESRLVCIPGMELTTYRGHCNMLGLTGPVRDFRVRTKADLHERLREARQTGASISINHPFKDCDTPGCRWEWGWDVDYDWVEVWNGPWVQCNKEALDWWQGQLVGGRRLVAVGGSDTHRPNQPTRHGTPTCWVWSRSRSVEAILEAVHAGHLFITYSPEGPAVELRCGGYMMGDEIAAPPVEELQVAVSRRREGDIIRVISDRGVEKEITVTGPVPGDEQALSLPVEDRRFYRVEVWRYFAQAGRTLMAAMTNPIYFGTSSRPR
jgi:hypothetical protein